MEGRLQRVLIAGPVALPAAIAVTLRITSIEGIPEARDVLQGHFPAGNSAIGRLPSELSQ